MGGSSLRRVGTTMRPVVRPLALMRGLLALGVLVALTACGGSDGTDASDDDRPARRSDAGVEVTSEPTAEVLDRVVLFEQMAQAQDTVRQRSEPAFADARAGQAWDWVLALPAEGAAYSLELVPQRGRGYAEPLLRLLPRSSRGRAAGEPLRPDCRSDSHCEFSGPVRFSVTLPPGGPLRAVPRGDAVALVARVLAVDQPVEVRLRLQAEGRPEQFRDITLMP